MGQLAIRSRASSPALKRAALAVEHAAWNELSYLNYTRPHFHYYDDLLEEYAEYQLCLVDTDLDYPVAVGCCVPLYYDGSELPDEGWDWVVETAAMTRGQTPNALGALAISVPRLHRGKGYARQMIRAMKDLARAKSLDRLIAPVRPTAKADHPDIPIETYIGWRDERGRYYDPWLRSHTSEGGRVVKACGRSMVVEEPLSFWEMWAGRKLDASGSIQLKGALVPVSIDVDRRIGRYEEPNVWVSYSLAA
jgi:GNAT superfamily N-acetyltransferase